MCIPVLVFKVPLTCKIWHHIYWDTCLWTSNHGWFKISPSQKLAWKLLTLQTHKAQWWYLKCQAIEHQDRAGCSHPQKRNRKPQACMPLSPSVRWRPVAAAQNVGNRSIFYSIWQTPSLTDVRNEIWKHGKLCLRLESAPLEIEWEMVSQHCSSVLPRGQTRSTCLAIFTLVRGQL